MRKLRIIFLLKVLPFLFALAGCEKDVVEPDGCYTLSVKEEGAIIVLTEPYTVEE